MKVDVIAAIEVIPIALPDPPLLNASGTHERVALRSIVRLRTSNGVEGVGEAHGGAALVADIDRLALLLKGVPISATRRALSIAVASMGSRRADRVFAPIEVAMLDALGKSLGLPVAEVLGGRVRDRVEFAGYLFFKWPAHLGETADGWGEIETADHIVQLADRMASKFGFHSWKIKGGVYPASHEIECVRALHNARPGEPVRIDPNSVWSFELATEVANRLRGTVEYLEDPCASLDEMAALRSAQPVPLATNMFAESFDEHIPLIMKGATDVVLLDHHVVGGLRRAVAIADMCAAAGLGMSMHSNSHTGVSLSAMTHLASVVVGDVRTNDTHYPWNADFDIVEPSSMSIEDGFVKVPTIPGLGVRIDEDRLAEAHARYVNSEVRERRDGDYARRVVPTMGMNLGPTTMSESGWMPLP